ncbi:hypothetical protein V5F32_05610 [Xanthobacter oligotrophicus]|uniref:Glycosyltransferase RgtA/B/C/D-like domain-containing protein n=1 Tax=Xanthobacter oligotrophicus TaxID=2607286 RepID=A0ABW6ZU94_9HYPH
MRDLADDVRTSRSRPFGWVVLAWVVLALAFALLATIETLLSPHFALWLDELFSLWTTDPTLPLKASAARITGDSNPPLYYALLRVVRIFVPEPTGAIFLSNGIALFSASAFVLWISARAGKPLLACLGIAAFALSGPTLFFFQEGRAYFLSNSLVFALTWQAALIVDDPAVRAPPVRVALLGAAAALSHVFAGLAAGAIAAGLLACGLLGKRKDLVAQGLALGGSATVVFGLWLASAIGTIGNIGWIQFSLADVTTAIVYVVFLSVGKRMLAPLVVFLGYAACLKRTRPMLILFGVAILVFVTLPIAVSFHTPLITGRYWQIGAPALIVALVFLARAFSMPPATPWGYAATIGVVLYLIVATVKGFSSARFLLEVELAWSGSDLVAKLAKDCPSGSVRIKAFGFDGSYASDLYSVASGLPTSLFVHANAAPPVSARDAPCPVIGWGEHVIQRSLAPLTASEEDILKTLNIEGTSGDVDIMRRPSGFVVLRASTRAFNVTSP